MCDLNNITEKGKPVEKQGRKAKDLKYRCIMVAGCQGILNHDTSPRR